MGLAVAACAATVAWVSVDEEPGVYALGDGVLSPQVREAGRDCLGFIRTNDRQSVAWAADSRARLLNHVERQGRGAIVVYLMRSKLIICLMGPAVKTGPEPRVLTDDGSLAIGYTIMDGTPWLPGPISMEAGRSTDLDGGYVDVAGRVSQRVERVVLDDGAGHQSTARLAEGTFLVFSDGRIPDSAGMLVSYDAGGQEIDRRPVLRQPSGRCYTDPAGNLVNPTSNYEFELAYKLNRAQCRRAEPWSARAASQPGRTGQR